MVRYPIFSVCEIMCDVSESDVVPLPVGRPLVGALQFSVRGVKSFTERSILHVLALNIDLPGGQIPKCQLESVHVQDPDENECTLLSKILKFGRLRARKSHRRIQQWARDKVTNIERVEFRFIVYSLADFHQIWYSSTTSRCGVVVLK
jgi:hypothetical protein